MVYLFLLLGLLEWRVFVGLHCVGFNTDGCFGFSRLFCVLLCCLWRLFCGVGYEFVNAGLYGCLCRGLVINSVVVIR